MGRRCGQKRWREEMERGNGGKGGEGKEEIKTGRMRE